MFVHVQEMIFSTCLAAGDESDRRVVFKVMTSWKQFAPIDKLWKKLSTNEPYNYSLASYVAHRLYRPALVNTALANNITRNVDNSVSIPFT